MSGAGPAKKRLCVGAIGAPHGVRGLVKIQPFTETPTALADYAPLTSADGTRVFDIAFKTLTKGQWIAAIDGVTDREAAAALRGTHLFVARESLPPPEDDETFYHADLMGLNAVDRADNPLGAVTAVYDFGAGDLLEISDENGDARMIPFTRTAVPTIDFSAGRLVIDLSHAAAADDDDQEGDS